MQPRFREPRFDAHVDLEAHVAKLPRDATCKGMFFRDVLALAAPVASAEEVAKLAGVPLRRYLPFLDYPMAENLRLTVATAKLVHPDQPLGEGLRRIGRTSFRTFLGSHVGRVLVATMSLDVGEVLVYGPRAFRLVMNFGEIHADRSGEKRVVSGCRGMPVFIETYQVGTIEGVFEHYGASGRVRVCLDDLANGTLEAVWQ